MRELLSVQDGGEGQSAIENGTSTAENGGDAGVSPLLEDDVKGIRHRTAAFLLGEGR